MLTSRHLKTTLKSLNLSRKRNAQDDEHDIKYKKLRKALLILNPEGDERGKQKVIYAAGPMYTLHNDGNYKLKRFGFPIHGCADGFSKTFK